VSGLSIGDRVASLVKIEGWRNLRVHQNQPTGGWNRQRRSRRDKEYSTTSTSALLADEVGYYPIEDRLRLNIRATIEAVFEEELEQFLGRCRYRRGEAAAKGYSHGPRERKLTTSANTCAN